MLAIITPAKNEGENLLRVADQLLSQKLPPDLWVIVDDNSNDFTLSIIRQLERKFNFINCIFLKRNDSYDEVTKYGQMIRIGVDFTLKKNKKPDYIAILDADMRLAKNYYFEIDKAFKANDTLGIASGLFFEIRNRKTFLGQKNASGPIFAICGADMVFKRECLLSIGGFPICPRPDTIAQLKAANRHWTIGIVSNTRAIHLRGNYSLQKYFKLGYACKALGYNQLTAIAYGPITALKSLSLAPIGFTVGYFSTGTTYDRVFDEEIRNYFESSFNRNVRQFQGILCGNKKSMDVIQESTKMF